MFFSGPFHANEQRLGDQVDPNYNSSVLIRDVAWENCRERWTIETSGETGSGNSWQMARHDDYDDNVRISLTLSRPFSLSFIASGWSSGLHPVSSHSCYMYVRASRPALARPYVGDHRSTSLMSSFLLLQQCPACLIRLTWMVFVMGGRCPYSWCLVGCCSQDFFNIARNIHV